MIDAPQNLRLELPVAQLADFCRRWGIARLEIFGSALRDDFGPESDVDFLFTPGAGFQRDKAYGPWMSDRMAEELGGLLGRPVDMLERSHVERMSNWIKRRHILQTAIPVMWTDDGTALDILTAARRIREFVAGLTRAQFDANLLAQSAILHQIIVLGEAVKRLSEEFRLAHPSVPWSQIAGMRDRCVHGYDNIELDRVWEVTQVHARRLVDYLEKIVPKPPSDV